MKKLLIITYYWPPAGGPGVQRWLKFAKCLRLHNWTPIILTPCRGTYQAHDFSLIKETTGIEVYKTKTIEPYSLFNKLIGNSSKTIEEMGGDLQSAKNVRERFTASVANFIRSNLFLPDARKLWRRYAVSKAIDLIRNKNIDAIITTGPPHSSHLIGLSLKKRLGIKWVVDFRDPWTDSVTETLLKPSRYAEKINIRYENTVLKFADILLVVSEGMKDIYTNKTKRVEVVFNGYDHSDFDRVKTTKYSDKFVFSYVGNFKILQNNEACWKTLSAFLTENNVRPEGFELKFTGNVNKTVKQSLIDHGLNRYAKFDGYQPHKEAIAIMQRANLLLFMNSNLPGIGKYVSGKIFEYLASGTPILAIAPNNGDVNKLLISCNRERAYDYSEMQALKLSLKYHYNIWENSKVINKIELTNKVEFYSRQNQATILSKLLDELIFNK